MKWHYSTEEVPQKPKPDTADKYLYCDETGIWIGFWNGEYFWAGRIISPFVWMELPEQPEEK
jgi:hypothetical protein